MKAVLVDDSEVSAYVSSLARDTFADVLASPQGRRAIVKDHPVPAIGGDEVLVKVVAVSQNPTDWKRTHLPLLPHPR